MMCASWSRSASAPSVVTPRRALTLVGLSMWPSTSSSVPSTFGGLWTVAFDVLVGSLDLRGPLDVAFDIVVGTFNARCALVTLDVSLGLQVLSRRSC